MLYFSRTPWYPLVAQESNVSMTRATITVALKAVNPKVHTDHVDAW